MTHIGLSGRRTAGIISTMKTLEAAKAADEFPRFLDRVFLHRESFKIVKKGVPFAYLIPAGERVGNSHQLADDLANNRLPAEERRAFATALRRGRKTLKPVINPWG
jgi:uncharacterized membrane protein